MLTLLIGVALVSMSSCSSVSLDGAKSYSNALPPNPTSENVKFAGEWAAQHNELSGVVPLHEGLDALGARLRMIEAAEVSIDAQYFLMKNDMAGHLFVAALIRAADRGVRVRLLVDDIFSPGLDDEYSLLSSHKNVEVRLFNPLSRFGFKYLNYLGNFKILNRRMHNKALIVDNSMVVTGGRNIAEEYYQLQFDYEFLDFDLFLVGAIGEEMSSIFDEFWNSDFSVPVETMLQPAANDALTEFRLLMDTRTTLAPSSVYASAVDSPFLTRVTQNPDEIIAADVTVVSDSPEKLKNKPKLVEYQSLVQFLKVELGKAEKEIVIVTPYFIPGDDGVAYLSEFVNRGISVKVMTNSLASTNHTPVHSSYARYRKKLLQQGVELYELKARRALKHTNCNVPDCGDDELAVATLHTKLILVDEQRFFSGSINYDPRSINLNTEKGVIVESVSLTQALSRELNQALPDITYKLSLNEGGKLRWHDSQNPSISIDKEPQATFWHRLSSRFYGLLPIEDQL